MQEYSPPQTEWQFFLNSESAWDAMLEAINNAKQTIDLEQFVFRYDTIGKKFIDILRQKARDGIKVRIIFDAVGAFYFRLSSEVAEMKKDGIQVIFFNPIIFSYPRNINIWYFRDHRKLLIVDSTVGFTGGICIGDDMRSWRETHVRIQGPVLSDMRFAFENMWLFSKKLKIEKVAPPPHENPSEFTYITNSPLVNRRHLYKEVWSFIERSKEYILLTTPYLLPDNRIFRALKKARERGVEICLLIPKASDHPFFDYGSHSYYSSMLKHGIKIYLYEKMIHTKTVIFDGTVATMGSLNFDNISLRFNFEANIVSTNINFIDELTQQFRNDLNQAERLTLEKWIARPSFEKIKEALTWPIRKFL